MTNELLEISIPNNINKVIDAIKARKITTIYKDGIYEVAIIKSPKDNYFTEYAQDNLTISVSYLGSIPLTIQLPKQTIFKDQEDFYVFIGKTLIELCQQARENYT